MITWNVFNDRTQHFGAHVLTAASCAFAILSMSACATTPHAFNPDNLQRTQLARVAQVCQSVMGLSPEERLRGGEWLGDSHLGYWTSYYRGCISSLSESVHAITVAREAQQLDHDCRARGYAAGSPDLAECVLRAEQRPHRVASPQLTSVTLSLHTEKLPTSNGSFFYASPSEAQRREQLACAALGIEPANGALDTCVNNLERTFHDIDTPII